MEVLCDIGTMLGMLSIRKNLDFVGPMNGLKTYSDYLIGVSLHDLKELKKHHPPGTGEI